jgi:hypothetical protein
VIFNYLLVNLGNTSKKEKELNRGFPLFNFSLILKGAFKLLLSNKLPKIKEVFLKHISTYPGPLDPHVSAGC